MSDALARGGGLAAPLTFSVVSTGATEDLARPLRDNDEWVRSVADDGPVGEAAQRDLRFVLVGGLRRMLDLRGVAEDLCEDLAQEARIRECLADFRSESRFTSWALAIGARIAFDELRHRRWKDVSFEVATADARGPLAFEPRADASQEKLLLRARRRTGPRQRGRPRGGGAVVARRVHESACPRSLSYSYLSGCATAGKNWSLAASLASDPQRLGQRGALLAAAGAESLVLHHQVPLLDGYLGTGCAQLRVACHPIEEAFAVELHLAGALHCL